MQIDLLLAPGLCVVVVTLIYTALVRWLFRGRLDLRLACLSFATSAGFVAASIGLFFIGHVGAGFGPSLLSELQAATTFDKMFRLALLYAALPEEAVKIGVVVVLLLMLQHRQRYGSDPAEMLLYSALGFAMSESLLYVVGFTALPQFKDHMLTFGAIRGIFGGFLHGLLGMVAGYLLARRWQSSQKWLWLLIAYAAAVLLHASFDGSLLHLVFKGMRARSSEAGLPVDGSGSLAKFLASAAALLIFALIALLRSRRLDSHSVIVPGPSR